MTRAAGGLVARSSAHGPSSCLSSTPVFVNFKLPPPNPTFLAEGYSFYVFLLIRLVYKSKIKNALTPQHGPEAFRHAWKKAGTTHSQNFVPELLLWCLPCPPLTRHVLGTLSGNFRLSDIT